MGLETRLTSNNSTYKTNTGGTHSSNVHHANTDHTSKTFRKGTIDLATANSHKVTAARGAQRAPAARQQEQPEVSQPAGTAGQAAK